MDQSISNTVRDESGLKSFNCDTCSSLLPAPGFYCEQCEPPSGPASIMEGELTFYQAMLRISLLILLFLAFSETDFNFEKLSFLSFNLVSILIFYWVLKNPDILGYGFIFLAGIVNDVIIGLPIGVSPITYLVLAGFAAYVRYLTVQPSLIYDWVVFIPAIAVTNSVYFYILRVFFELDINYIALLLNTGVTILFYPVVGFLFNFLADRIIKERNV